MSKPSDAPLTEPQRRLAAQWMPLVYSTVAKHAQSAADRADLLSGLQLALMRAARRFDPRRGFTFQALATRALNNAVIDVRRRQQTRRPEVNGLEDWQLERAVCKGYEPAPARRDTKPENTELAPARPSAIDSARALLQDGAPFRDIATATGLRYWQVRQLAQELGIKRLPGRPSRLGEALVVGGLTPKEMREATGLTSGAISRRCRTIRYRLKKSHRRQYRPAAYILQIMQTGDPKSTRRAGRPLAVPEKFWPELRLRQIAGTTLEQMKEWLSTHGCKVSVATLSRTLERIGAVAPARTPPSSETIAEIEPLSNEEALADLRLQMLREAKTAADWRARQGAVGRFLQILDAQKPKTPVAGPPQPATPAETEAALTPEQEAEMVRQQLGKRAQA